MKRFAVLLHLMVIWRASEFFVEVGAWILRVLSPNPNIGTEPQGIITTAWEGYQMPILSMPERGCIQGMLFVLV